MNEYELATIDPDQLVLCNSQWPHPSPARQKLPSQGYANQHQNFYEDNPNRIAGYQYTQTTNTSPVKKSKPEENPCVICKKNFPTFTGLKRHLTSVHGNNATGNKRASAASQQKPKTERVPRSERSFLYKCDFCERRFNFKTHYRYHIRLKHAGAPAVKKAHACILCEELFERKALMVHYKELHEINMVTEEFKFPSIGDFKSWKIRMEDQNSCKYTCSRGKKVYGNAVHWYYSCNVSGYAKSDTAKSVKINAVCPSSLTVTEQQGGICSVVFMKTHLGHDNNQVASKLEKLETDSTDNQVVKKKIFHPLHGKRADLKKTFGKLVDGISSTKDLDFLEKTIASAGKAMEMMRSSKLLFQPELNVLSKNEEGQMTSMKWSKDLENDYEDVAITFVLKRE